MMVKQEHPEREVHLLEILHVLVKRKRLIATFCAVAALLSVVYSLFLPNVYTATAKVLPPQKEGGGGLAALLGGQAGALAGLVGSIGGLGGGTDLYIGILKSRSVRDAVIQRLDLGKVYKRKTIDDTRHALEQVVTLQAGKDGIISISAEDKDPKRAALLANTLVDELGKTTVRLNLTKAGTEKVFLEKRLEVVKRDLKDAEESLKEFAQQNKVVQVDAQARAAIESIARLKAELASKEVQLSVLRNKMTDQAPEVQAAQAGLARLRGEIGRLAGKNGGPEGIPSVGSVPSVGLEYMRRLRTLKAQEAVYEQLMKQYEMAKLTEAKDSSTLQVLDEAVVPLKKTKPMRALIVVFSTLAAFLLGSLYALMQEYLKNLPQEERESIENIKKEALLLR